MSKNQNENELTEQQQELLKKVIDFQLDVVKFQLEQTIKDAKSTREASEQARMERNQQ